ncbi:helix-turn-helix domain-containing protein [Bradyrhizobium cenepequi]
MTATIPTVHFDTSDLPADKRFDTWRSAVHAHRAWLPEGTDPAQFCAVVDAWTLGELVVALSRLPAVFLARTPEMARADGEDWMTLAFQLKGATVFTLDHGGLVRTIGPGEIIVFDMTRDFRSETSAHEVITCAISRRAMLQATYEIPPHHGLVIDGGWGRLLADYMLSLVRQLPEMAAADAPGLGRTFVHLLGACLKAASAAQPAISRRTADTRHLAETYIEDNLTSPDLDPVTICKALGISKARLYRAFANSEGVTAYIRKRRLAAIHVLLNNPRETRSIGEIAYQYGFVSDAHFSRVFRQKFGFSPRDVRAGQPVAVDAGADEDDETTIFRRWIQRLS